MKSLLFACCMCIALFSHTQSPDKAVWESMFNGKDLNGWTPKITHYPAGENFGNTFRVDRGKLVVRYDAYTSFDGRFGHLFYNKPYGYYRMRVTYRFTGVQAAGGPEWALRNSGVMIHGQTPETMGKDQDFPVSIEVQFLGGDGKTPRSTCNLCTPGTHVEMNDTLFTPHCINSKSKTYKGSKWVTAEIRVFGDSLIQHYVNGTEVMAYQKPQLGGGSVSGLEISLGPDGQLLQGGTISLQSESHPIEFKNIEILPLEGCMDPKALNYKSYYVKSIPSECRYN